MTAPFVDKNGIEIKLGDVVRFTSNECVGEQQHGRGRNKRTYSVYRDIEIVATVRLGLFKTIREELYTYWLDTDQAIEYPTYFWSIRARDLPRMHTSKMSRPLSTEIAAKCEVVHLQGGEQ